MNLWVRRIPSLASLSMPSSLLAVARREYAFMYRSSIFKASVQSTSASRYLMERNVYKKT